MADPKRNHWGAWSTFFQWAMPKGDDSKRSPKGVLLLILVGVLLMLWGQTAAPPPTGPEAVPVTGPLPLPPEGDSDPIALLERELTVALNQMLPAGTVKVLIVPSVSQVTFFAEEVTTRTSTARTAAQGGDGGSESVEESVTRRPVLVRVDGGRTEEPLITHTKRPEIAGVLVVADGADDPAIRLRLLEAVSTALDVPAHRVEIEAKRR